MADMNTETYQTAYWSSLAAWCQARAQCRTFTCPGTQECGLCAYSFNVRWSTMCNTLTYYGYLDIAQFASPREYAAWLHGFNIWWAEYKWAERSRDAVEEVNSVRAVKGVKVVDLETFEFEKRSTTPKSYGRNVEYMHVRPRSAESVKLIGSRVVDSFPALDPHVDPNYEDNSREDVTMGMYSSLPQDAHDRIHTLYTQGRINAVVQSMLRAVYDPSSDYDDSVCIVYVGRASTYRSLLTTVLAERTVRNLYAGSFTPEVKLVSSAKSLNGIVVERGGRSRVFVMIYREAQLTDTGVGGIFRSADLMIRGAKEGRIVITKHVPNSLYYVVENIGGDMFVTYSDSDNKLLWMEGISNDEYLAASEVEKRKQFVMRITMNIGHGMRIHSCMRRRAIMKLTDVEAAYYRARSKLERFDDVEEAKRHMKQLTAMDRYAPQLDRSISVN